MQTNRDVETITPSCFLTFSRALKGHITDKTLESANTSWQNMSSSYIYIYFFVSSDPDYRHYHPCSWQGDLKGYHFILNHVCQEPRYFTLKLSLRIWTRLRIHGLKCYSVVRVKIYTIHSYTVWYFLILIFNFNGQ